MKKIDEKRCDEAVKLYNNGLGIKAISKKLAVNPKTVSAILKRRGVWVKDNIRPFKNLYDIHFFNSYTSENCYWAGFILADGNIRSGRKCLQIGLKKDDVYHLQKFSNAINFTGPIYKDIRKSGYESVKICISGKWLVDDLNKNFNIYSKKSLVAIFSEKIPKEYLSDFIRGYFDGDGGITQNKNGVRISFIGTQNVMSRIRNIFEDEIGVYIPKINKDDKMYRLQYYCGKAKSVLDWLYVTSNYKIRLDRKYYKYEKCVKNKSCWYKTSFY